MENTNNNPAEATAAPAPVVSAPEAVAAPAVTAAPAAPAAPPGEMPKTDGKTPGGWNRFAGYNPNAAKSKQKDGRGGPKGRR